MVVILANTKARDVYDSFESSFQDKKELSPTLELVWLLKAIGRYSVELDALNFDEDTLEFDSKLDRYVIDTLGAFMLEYYQERQVSKVNKYVSIVGKDISVDGAGHTKTAEKELLDYNSSKSVEMVENQKPTAYV